MISVFGSLQNFSRFNDVPLLHEVASQICCTC
jgi:hypothetical protein